MNMKLPIQKTGHRGEEMRQSGERGLGGRGLMERFLPEELLRPWFNFEKDMYKEMESWMPKVDISETEKELHIIADVPGIRPENIKVEVAEDSLIMSGKSEEEKEEEGKMWHRVERRSGSFYREFELPKSADLEQIEATIKNGTLHIKLMKKPEAQSRTIEVKQAEEEEGQEEESRQKEK